MADLVKTFEIADPGVETEVATQDTGFSWAKTLSEPDNPSIAVEPKRLPDNVRLLDEGVQALQLPAAEPGHKERFDALFEAAVKPQK